MKKQQPTNTTITSSVDLNNTGNNGDKSPCPDINARRDERHTHVYVYVHIYIHTYIPRGTYFVCMYDIQQVLRNHRQRVTGLLV